MRKWYSVLLILSFLTLLPAAVILNEGFGSDTAWNAIVGRDTIDNGKMVLKCQNSLGLVWALNTTLVPADFSLTVETAMSGIDLNARIGVTIRTQDNTDSYHFYVYPEGCFMIMKYTVDSAGYGHWADFSSGKLVANTFIRPDVNNLKIIGRGDSLSFLCNGQLLAAIRDVSIPGAGKVGLIVCGKVAGAFDNLVIDDAPVADPGLTSFSDNFNNPALPGWAGYGTGRFSVVNGKLRDSAAAGTGFSTIVSDGNYGPYDTLSVTTARVVVPVPANYIYGLQYHYSTVLENSYLVARGYIFCIVNNTYFCVLKLGSTVAQLFPPQISTSISQNNANTLKVICGAAGKMDLYINGTLVKSITDASYPAGGVGLMANGGSVIDFSSFNLNQPPLISVEEKRAGRAAVMPLGLLASPNPFSPATQLNVNGSAGASFKLAIYDVQGNRLEKWEGTLPAALTFDAGSLPPGIYFARLMSGTRTLTNRLVLIR